MSEYNIPHENTLPVTPENFINFSYSKKSHFDIFRKNNYDKLLYGKVIEPSDNSLIVYQNLLIYSFIKQNIKTGAKILQIGNDETVVSEHFKLLYDCRILKDVNHLRLSAIDIERNDVPVIKDNKGNMQNKLPEDYFDFVFSVSALNDPGNNKSEHINILDNLNKILKPGGYSLHCFSGPASEEEYFFYHNFLDFINKSVTSLIYNTEQFHKFPVDNKVIADHDLHFTYEKFKTPKENLKTYSRNFLWKKKELMLNALTKTKNYDYFGRYPVYLFHHLMKCAGSSVVISLSNWFYMEYDLLENVKDLNNFMRHKINILDLYSDLCITGHFQYDGIYLHQRYPEILERKNDFKLFTFIRDPLYVKMSLYYYVRNRGGYQTDTLKESLEYKNNFLASLLPCNESNYKEVLDRYFFIGIVEKMQESMDKLADLLNKKRIKVPVANTSEKDTQISELTHELIDEFKQKNKLDYMIYDYCLEKFKKI